MAYGDALSAGFDQAPAALQDTPARQNQRFLDWYRQTRVAQGMNPDVSPDDPEHYYDLRGFYADMTAGKPGLVSPDKPGGHFPSEYKKAGHPRTYLQDSRGRIFDTRSGQYLNGEEVSRRSLKTSERSPDMPGFDPKTALQLGQALGALR